MTDGSQKCRRCGDDHDIVECPGVKAVEYHSDGKISRLEFVTVADFPPTRQEATAPPENYPKLGKT